MKLTVKKATSKLNSKAGVPADQLKVIYAVRTLGDERKLGQYKLVSDKVKYFNNFLEFRYFSDRVLYYHHVHVILVRGEVPNEDC